MNLIFNTGLVHESLTFSYLEVIITIIMKYRLGYLYIPAVKLLPPMTGEVYLLNVESFFVLVPEW